MCRINEVILMKKGDIQLGYQRRSRKSPDVIRYGCCAICDRKTDHDPLCNGVTWLRVNPLDIRVCVME